MTWPRPDRLPAPPQPSPPRERSPWPFLAFLAFLLISTYLLTRAFQSDTPVVVTLPTAPLPIGTPALLTFPSVVTVRLLETPTSVPTATPLPTPSPTPDPSATLAPLMCSLATKVGETCIQPPIPSSTPTPIGPCPAPVNQPCIYGGGAVAYLPTPTPTPA